MNGSNVQCLNGMMLPNAASALAPTETITINLPHPIAAQLAAWVPKGEREQFASDAIAAALAARDEAGVRLAEALLAGHDPTLCYNGW